MRLDLGFTSIFYFWFLALVWFLHRALDRPKIKQVVLLAASYLFYASWTPWFLLVLLGSSICNFGWARWLRRRPSAVVLWSALAFNILLLGFFKYLAWMLGLLGVEKAPFPNTLAPIGLSFYTFQAMSALLDVYRRADKTEPSLTEFLLYMAFWPTVLAGPVSRLGEMVPQFRRTQRPTLDDLVAGGSRIALGLVMKLVVADALNFGVPVGSGISGGFEWTTRAWSGTDVWFLAVGFGFQLFCDFAGYSHIAIGSARMLGVHVRENFHDPYLSKSPTEFWTRWHISLSSWIRDYLFFPLAALRRELWWRYLALVVAMTLFGLWHGANITFVLWGSYHGALLVAHRFLQRARRLAGPFPMGRALETALSWAITFMLVSLGWVFFRAKDLRQVSEMLVAVGSPSTYSRLSLPPTLYVAILTVAAGYFGYVGVRSRLLRVLEESREVAALAPSKF